MPSVLDILKSRGQSTDNHIQALSQTAPQLLYTQQRLIRETARNAYVTEHALTKDMLATANMLSSRDEPVLILGPTGTGKELVARILHASRASRTQPSVEMVTVNCSGLPEGLFESLVFGHKKGSFTGSIGDSEGLLRAAKDSTAFLDEVGDLPLPQQAKLLRVLATNKVRPVGDSDEYTINCRFVFATHRDLKSMMLAGKFREDLYYRISPVVLHTYPLVERPMDIIPIAKAILRSFNIDESSADITDIPVAAYSTGNVRQLHNFLFRRFVVGWELDQALNDL